MSHDTLLTHRYQRVVLAVLVVSFLAAGLARLNPFCLLEPDTPDYLFASRAMVHFEGYREIDHPAMPLHTFRPPGLPLLLAPLSLARPYDVVGAKLLVLAASVALLWLTWRLAAVVAGRRGALAAAALVATSPYTLLHATEVVTEVPYLACTLGLLVLASATPRLGGGRTVVAGALLVLAPLLRTIGVALALAATAWCSRDRSRRPWWIVCAAGLAATTLWAVRSSFVGGPTYVASILSGLQTGGAGEFAAGVADKLAYYAVRFGDVMLPGVRSAQPLYERVLLEPAADLGPAGALAVPLGLILAGLALAGMWCRRGAEGGLAALYVVLFVAGLSVYPPRHERLLWPLVPLVWIYALAGWRAAREALSARRPGTRRMLRWTGLAFVIVLALWQARASASMAYTNLLWRAAPEAFHAEQVPPSYYADWQAAGRWIAANAPPHAIVLTRHSDVGFTARRYQDSVRFEELSPRRWRARIAELHARYLVVSTAQFGRYFPWNALTGDPVYALVPVYDALGVMVLEVQPNRSGTVRANEQDPVEDIEACRRAVERHPQRVELRRRLAEMLAAGGRHAEAVSLLQALTRSGSRDPGVYKTLGSILLDEDRPGEALDSFRAAARLPEAELLESSIARGIERARERLERPTPPPAQRGGELTRAALGQLEVLRPGEALDLVEQAVRLAPSDPSVRFARGRVLARLGRVAEARREFEACAGAGHPEAPFQLALIDLAARAEASTVPIGSQQALRLAGAFVQDGTPGRALALLESRDAVADATERLRLADLYLYYGRAEQAVALYEQVLQAAPANTDARRGVGLARELLRTPSF